MRSPRRGGLPLRAVLRDSGASPTHIKQILNRAALQHLAAVCKALRGLPVDQAWETVLKERAGEVYRWILSLVH